MGRMNDSFPFGRLFGNDRATIAFPKLLPKLLHAVAQPSHFWRNETGSDELTMGMNDRSPGIGSAVFENDRVLQGRVTPPMR